jgi:hypothetical protein
MLIALPTKDGGSMIQTRRTKPPRAVGSLIYILRETAFFLDSLSKCHYISANFRRIFPFMLVGVRNGRWRFKGLARLVGWARVTSEEPHVGILYWTIASLPSSPESPVYHLNLAWL